MRAFIVLSGIALIFFLTNPDEQEFLNFAEAQIEGAINARTEQTEFGKLLAGAGGAAARMFIDEFMERQNFLLFSIYTIDYDGEPDDGDEWKFLGIMTTFMELNRPSDDSNPIGIVE